MATARDLRQRLKNPLKLELASGCQDSTVVGGIEKLVNTVGKPFADIRLVLEGYSGATITDRKAKIETVLELIAQKDAKEKPKQVQDVVPTPKPRKAKKDEKSFTERLPSSILNHALSEKTVDLGAQAQRKLATIGITNYRDLVFYFPKRYEDRRALPNFSMLGEQEAVTVVGTVTGRKTIKARTGMAVLRAFLEDSNGSRLTVVWFNQPWLEKQLFPGQKLIVSGKLKRKGRQIELNAAHHEIDDEGESLSADCIVGIYASTQGLSQAYIRRSAHKLFNQLATIPDHLPKTVLERYDLIPLDEALREIHFPQEERSLQKAIRRLKFDEFFFLELRVLLNRDTELIGKHFKVKQKDLKEFKATLPFKLTQAQSRALKEILDDMANPRQMARLLQGDVGSGKTAVAAAAIYIAIKNGYQAALMAPTEILARQHYINLIQYLYPLGVQSELIIGTMGTRERRDARARLQSTQVDLAIGTHALIQEGVEFHNLGLVVIDEEHRFGVEQRRKLLESSPDVIVMSATPIPRSLALTYYGDLELSIIDKLPPGRKPIKTRLVNDSKRRDVYRFAWGEIQKGRQVYLVTPLIEDSEAEAMSHIVSSTQMFDDLKAIMPKACRIEMLHGKMSGHEKDSIMERFRNNDFDLLVSTTVIEVGVDIPNATVMIIENAERFGLSQLHQLRGRVGRGEHESFCILVAGDRSKKTQQRLEVIEKYTDGFVIAEKDLELRGPGELRGTRQSGMPDLVLGDLSQDGDIIEKSRELAKKMLEADPKLEAGWATRIKEELLRQSEAIGFRQIV